MMWRRILKWLGIVLGLLLALQLWYLGHVLWWMQFNPSSTAFMEAGLERLQEKRPEAELRHQWIEYQRISINLKRAVVAAEDAKFLAHEGFDWEGIETESTSTCPLQDLRRARFRYPPKDRLPASKPLTENVPNVKLKSAPHWNATGQPRRPS